MQVPSDLYDAPAHVSYCLSHSAESVACQFLPDECPHPRTHLSPPSGAGPKLRLSLSLSGMLAARDLSLVLSKVRAGLRVFCHHCPIIGMMLRDNASSRADAATSGVRVFTVFGLVHREPCRTAPETASWATCSFASIGSWVGMRHRWEVHPWSTWSIGH